MQAVYLAKAQRIAMIILVGILLPGVLSAQSFRILDLGTLGGAASSAVSLDDNNTVVGWSETISGERHAFSSCPTCDMSDPGHLPGGSISSATAISSNGRYIVGYSGINEYGISFEQSTQGFILSNDTILSVGALYCPCTFNTRYGFSEAHAVNDYGEVVGYSETVRGRQVTHAFLWKDGVMHDIGGGAGDRSISSALAINNLSQVAGDFTANTGATDTGTRAPNRRAFLWQNGNRQDLGVLPGHSSSSALALNDDGMVVGWSGRHDGSLSTAFLWHNSIMENLGYLPGDSNSRAVSINNVGQIVGVSGTDLSNAGLSNAGLSGAFPSRTALSSTALGTEPDITSGTSSQSDPTPARPFLWQNGAMLDLNSLLPAEAGWVIIDAADINNRGWIAGTGLREGRTHAILLEPVDSVPQ